MREQFDGQVEIIGLGGLGPYNEISDFVRETAVGTFPHVFDHENQIREAYDIRSQPRYVFINDNGDVSEAGALGLSGLKSKVEQLVNT